MYENDANMKLSVEFFLFLCKPIKALRIEEKVFSQKFLLHPWLQHKPQTITCQITSWLNVYERLESLNVDKMHLECFSNSSSSTLKLIKQSRGWAAKASRRVSSKCGIKMSGRSNAFELIIFRPRKSDHEHKEDKKESRAANIVTTNSDFKNDFWHSAMHFCCHSRSSFDRPPKWARRNRSRSSETCVGAKTVWIEYAPSSSCIFITSCSS